MDLGPVKYVSCVARLFKDNTLELVDCAPCYEAEQIKEGGPYKLFRSARFRVAEQYQNEEGYIGQKGRQQGPRDSKYPYLDPNLPYQEPEYRSVKSSSP
jgi:hypothetical protein